MPSSKSSYTEEPSTSSFNKHNLLWFVFTVLVFSSLVKLGLWQNSRAEEKEQRLTHIEKLTTQNAISLEEVMMMANKANNFQVINDFPVLIEGIFSQEHVFFLDNQTNKGRLGYRVYQIASSNDYSVLVNLGWVQGSLNRDYLPDIKALHGEYRFKGNIRLIELGILLQEQIFSEVTWPLRVQQIELDKFSSLIGHELLPFVVYLDKNEDIGFEKNWQPIVMPPEKHRAYAFQWFSLSLAWLLLMLWARYGDKIRNNNNKSKAI